MEQDRRFFNVGKILVASLLGSLPAGLFLYRHNACLFGKEKDGNVVFVLGTIFTFLGVLGSVLGRGPVMENLVRAFGPVSVLLPVIVARRTQADDLKRYKEEGGLEASYGMAALIGGISLVAILAVAFLVARL